MTWQIKAWLEDGKSLLEILDSDSGEVHLRWEYQPGGTETGAPGDPRHLFRELLLLSCKQDLCNGLFSARSSNRVQVDG